MSDQGGHFHLSDYSLIIQVKCITSDNANKNDKERKQLLYRIAYQIFVCNKIIYEQRNMVECLTKNYFFTIRLKYTYKYCASRTKR